MDWRRELGADEEVKNDEELTLVEEARLSFVKSMCRSLYFLLHVV